MKTIGYIYVAQFGAFVKIGHSTNPAQRIAELHTCRTRRPPEVKARPKPLLAMAGSKTDEKRLHQILAPFRLNGSEWYPDSILSHSEVAKLPFLPFSTVAKRPERFINAFIRMDLWRQFRSALLKAGLTVPEGLEQAIEVWLAHENSE